MDYIFGYEYLDGVEEEVVKTVSREHSDLNGRLTVNREFDDSVITDSFGIVRKYRASEDEEGRYYDWYVIKDHFRYEDRFTPGIKATEQEITDLEIEAMEQAEQLTDAEIAIMELQDIINGLEEK